MVEYFVVVRYDKFFGFDVVFDFVFVEVFDVGSVEVIEVFYLLRVEVVEVFDIYYDFFSNLDVDFVVFFVLSNGVFRVFFIVVIS